MPLWSNGSLPAIPDELPEQTDGSELDGLACTCLDGLAAIDLSGE